MSVKVMTVIWDHYPNGGGEFLTALALADHADHEGGSIFPSVASLSTKTQQSERTIQYQLKAMLANGWLVKVAKGGKGAGATTRYRIPIELIPQGVVGRVQTVAPESSRTVSSTTISKPAKGAKGAPSATALAFKAYAHGIQERYGAAYPPSAKANGQLANVVARVGGDNALALVQYYLACPNQFYPKTRHSLDYLVRDCERLFIDMQAAAGKPPPDENGNPPKPAWAEVVLIDAAEKEVFHSTGKTGDPDRIAGYCTQKFASEIRRKKATHLVVRQGGEEKRYSIAELMNHQGNA